MSEDALCAYLYGPAGDCFDTGCGASGGRCRYVGPPGRFACRCNAPNPSPNRAEWRREVPVEPWFGKYQAMVDAQPICDDSWFQEQWRKKQSGDETAGRLISGSCLRFALQIAQQRAAEFPECHLLNVIEEANAGLMEAVLSFGGGSKEDFLHHAEACIDARLAALA